MMVTIDPTNNWPKDKRPRLVAACGLLPMFFVDAINKGLIGTQEVYDDMVKTYGFGDFSGPSWGSINEETGVYVSSYEEDEDLAPMVTMDSLDGPTLYIYQHAIIGLVGPDGVQIVSRMD